jgi:hypothetical protein
MLVCMAVLGALSLLYLNVPGKCAIFSKNNDQILSSSAILWIDRLIISPRSLSCALVFSSRSMWLLANAVEDAKSTLYGRIDRALN